MTFPGFLLSTVICRALKVGSSVAFGVAITSTRSLLTKVSVKTGERNKQCHERKRGLRHVSPNFKKHRVTNDNQCLLKHTLTSPSAPVSTYTHLLSLAYWCNVKALLHHPLVLYVNTTGQNNLYVN